MARRSRKAGSVFVAATTLVSAEAGEAGRLYTNADLAKFGPPAAATQPVATEDPGWEFVAEFIERERARLDAERAHELDRRHAALAEAEAAERAAPVYGYPFLTGYWPGDPGRDPDRGRHGIRRVASPSVLGDRIVPLHARPSDALRMRARAVRLSGVDAFPSNARRAD